METKSDDDNYFDDDGGMGGGATPKYEKRQLFLDLYSPSGHSNRSRPKSKPFPLKFTSQNSIRKVVRENFHSTITSHI